MVSQSENSDVGISEFHTNLHKISDLRRSCWLTSWQGTEEHLLMKITQKVPLNCGI